jgi:hypothetical protein
VGVLRKLLLQFRPPKINDPDFGTLVYIYIPRSPSRSYWEGEWLFPPTRTKVAITLPGALDGPLKEARMFHLQLPSRFDQLLSDVRPALNRVFQEWLGRPLNSDLWQDVRLSGFGVDDVTATPRTWEVSFETTSEKWLGITIPFSGDSPQDPIVDT